MSPILNSLGGLSARAFGFESVVAASAPTTGFVSIATTTVGSGGASTITFSGIPSVYKHLQIRALSRGTDAGNGGINVKLKMNNDSGSNYSWHLFDTYQGAANAVESIAGTTQTSIVSYVQSSAGNASNIYAGAVIDILDYQNTNKYKTTRTLFGYDINGSTSGYSYVGLYSGLWQSTSAITQIDLTCPSASFAQYSSFALYGIQGA